MPITTIKRCQSDPDWWYTVEDYCDDPGEPGSGLRITYYDEGYASGKLELAVSEKDALLLRDAINHFYPPNKETTP
jgi:hypothetical protein